MAYGTEDLEVAQEVADAILYEGYVLYPYRRSSPKNQVRWQFGVLLPRVWAQAHGLVDEGVAGSAESWWQRTECLLEAADDAVVQCRLRFLHFQHRSVQQGTENGGYEEISVLESDSGREMTFDEAVPHQFDLSFPVADGERRFEFTARGHERRWSIGDPPGRVVRTRWPVTAIVTVSIADAAASGARLRRLRVQVENSGTMEPGAARTEALRHSLIATHTLLAVPGGRFVSLLDPPQWAAKAARACSNVHTFPVLAGAARSREVVLSSPILLQDHPRVSPESPANLHDATEIDEILSLRTLALTDEEKREARATDPRAAAIIDRVDAMSGAAFARLHGTIRTPRPGTEGVAIVNGLPVTRGDRVRLHPRLRGTDPQDVFLAGRTGVVESVLVDMDGARQLAVTLEDDPAAELNRWYGRFRYFAPEEVEPLGREDR